MNNHKIAKKNLFRTFFRKLLIFIYGTADIFFRDFCVGALVKVFHNNKYYEPLSAYHALSL